MKFLSKGFKKDLPLQKKCSQISGIRDPEYGPGLYISGFFEFSLYMDHSELSSFLRYSKYLILLGLVQKYIV